MVRLEINPSHRHSYDNKISEEEGFVVYLGEESRGQG